MFENEEQFELWCCQNAVSDTAKSVLKQIRLSNPSRTVRSGRSNMSGRFPSRKMGVVIQFESHRNELPHIRILEDDEDTIEYYDQSIPIKLSYEGANGKRVGVFHTPDFFVIRKNSAGWEECKTEQALLELETKNPNRYSRDERGEWRCQPGEEYASPLGFSYTIITSKDIDWIFQRNLEFLEDYFRADFPAVVPSAHECVITEVSNDFGISLEDLFNRTSKQASRDDVFMMIACEEIYVDLHSVALPEFKYVRVFPNRDTASAYQNVMHDSSAPLSDAVLYVALAPNETIRWDNKHWQVVNVGERFVSLLGEENKLIELPIAVANSLIEEGRISAVTQVSSLTRAVALEHPEVKKKLLTASREDLAIANYRLKIVRAYLSGKALPSDADISERTIRHWAMEHRKAEDSYSCGYVGLIPKPRSGNGNLRLPVASQKLMDEFIQNSYESLKQRRRRAVHDQYVVTCEEKQIEPASYVTFCRTVRLRPQNIQKEKRVGSRGAYSESEFYWELELKTPRHGDRPFHIVHIDHTLADAEAVCSHTGKNMGKPWVSFMIDAFSRRILAKYITYDPPSYRTNMMLIRECVRRFKRFFQIVIVDGAFEFSCTYFETLLALFEATKKVRPPAKPRFGSVSERLFGTANSQFFHNLEGNTQIMKNVRQVTKYVNPQNHAIWTLESLDAMLTEWAYEVYDTTEHPALGQSPREAFNQGMELYGTREFKIIPYEETFRMLTMPPTSRGKAKVTDRGIKINNIRYWADAFNDERVKGTCIPTRLDPWNAGVIYAFARQRWVEAYSEYNSVFRNRSEREMMLASEELRRRHKLHSSRSKITARKLAEFLQSVEAEEVLLHQRLADLAARQIAVGSGLLSSNYVYGAGKNVTQNERSNAPANEGAHDQSSLDSKSTSTISQIYKTL